MISYLLAITNTGTITGYQVGLSAGQDLQDLSGLIAGSTSTSLSAGRDLLLATQTTTATGATGSTTSLDHVVTVQGGTITLQAARDLIAQGATIAASGGLTAVAGRNLSLGAATTTYQFASGGPLIPPRRPFSLIIFTPPGTSWSLRVQRSSRNGVASRPGGICACGIQTMRYLSTWSTLAAAMAKRDC